MDRPGHAAQGRAAGGRGGFARRLVLALRRIEFESSRLIQAQILFLKGPDLLAVRTAVSAAVERHCQVREAWATLLARIGAERETKD